MSTAPAEHTPDVARRRRRAWLAVATSVLLLAAVLLRCDAFEDEEPSAAPAPAFAAEGALAEVLTARGRALEAGDREAWLALVGEEPAYAQQQDRLYGNLAQLPLRVVRWVLVAGSARVDGGDVVADVRRELQVDGWDAAPVVTVAAFRFRLTSTPDGERYRLVGDTETSAPWDRAPVRVLRDQGALVVTDAADDRVAGLAGEVAAAIAAVQAEVPFPWAGTAMVYAVDDVSLLADIEGLPVEDPEQLDGVAFPVWSDPDGGGEVVALRVVLHPRVLGPSVGVESRDRLLRHELTHVALGKRDDRVPTWLSEGVAEYVAVRATPPSQRVISRAALDAARSGATGLPGDDAFTGARSGASYGFAWFACEEIAASYGAAVLWELLENYAAAPDESRDSVLRRTIGLDQAGLGAAAAERILTVFG